MRVYGMYYDILANGNRRHYMCRKYRHKGEIMMKIKKLAFGILVAFVITLCLPVATRATTDSVWSGQFTVYVNDARFELWGYSTDVAIYYFCLFDMAYMLNGTPAQFNIRTPLDARWDYWIVRGEPFTPTGREFQPIPERWATRADGGGLFGWDGEDSGFDYYPEQTLVVGIDGEGEPLTSLAIYTIQDVDNTYFMASSLASLLGLDYIITTNRWHAGDLHDNYVTGVDLMLTTGVQPPAVIPIQPPELARMLVRISGQWVDAAHFYSPTIDESVIWPAEISISTHGIRLPVTQSLVPIIPEWTVSSWEWEWLWWYPVAMRNLERGIVELMVTQPQAQPAWSATIEHSQEDMLASAPSLQDYRIIVDPRQEPVNSIILYIGDIPHTMRRVCTWDSAARYHVQPAEEGGIKLNYVLPRWTFRSFSEREFRVYRSAAPITQRGFTTDTNFIQLNMELMHTQRGISQYDRIIFEFIDHTAENGQVYYYSLWRMGEEWHENVTPGGESHVGSMRVVVDDMLGIAEVEDIGPETNANEAIPPSTPETETPADAEISYTAGVMPSGNEISNHSNRRGVWIAAALFVAVLLALAYAYRRKISNT